MSLSVLQFSIYGFFCLFFWLLPNHWSKRKKQQVDTLSKLKETVFIRTFLPDKCKRFIDIRMINIWSSASTGILKSTETYKLRIYVISMNIYRLWGLAVIHSLFSRLKYKYITDIGWLPINLCTHFLLLRRLWGLQDFFLMCYHQANMLQTEICWQAVEADEIYERKCVVIFQQNLIYSSHSQGPSCCKVQAWYLPNSSTI